MVDERTWVIFAVFAYVILLFLDFAGWIPLGLAVIGEDLIYLGFLAVGVLILGEIRDQIGPQETDIEDE